MPPSKKSKERAAAEALLQKGFGKREKVQRERLASILDGDGPDDIPAALLDRHPVLELPPPAGTPFLAPLQTNANREHLNELLIEQDRRAREPLRLYQPLRVQQDFHQSTARVRLAIGSNRAGKTIATCVEFARAITGTDPYDKYPTSGTAYIVGKHLKHIGDTIYTKLFRRGFFKVIRGGDGEWQAFLPWNPDHAVRAAEAVDSEPLIPGRYVVSISYENKAENEISAFTIRTPRGEWIVRCFSAKGSLPQGNAVDLVLLDEEIQRSPDGEWYPEMLARLVDRKGRLIWSAAPQSGFENLQEVCDRADHQLEVWRADPVNNPPPEIVRFDIVLSDNRFQASENVAWFERNLSDEDRLVRFEGVNANSTLRMYPEFSLKVHGFPISHVPDHWTRYVVVDPGHVICAVLFGAVPPLDESPGRLDTLLLYDELYLAHCNASLFAQRMQEKIGTQTIEEFIIDMQGARPTEAGTGVSVLQQYVSALELRNVRSRSTGSGFVAAVPDRRGGVLKVHEYMLARPGGRPRLLVAVDPEDLTKCRLPNFHAELRKYRKKRVAGIVTEDAEDRGPTHLMQCMRYMVAREPGYVHVERHSRPYQAYLLVKQMEDRIKRRTGQGSVVNFGPG